jgi:hypothetical protein
MAGTRNKTARAKTDSDPWPPGASFALTQDDGWVSALKDHWANTAPEVQQFWGTLLQQCHEARPRSDKTWLDAEDEAESKCGYPPMGFPGEEPRPEPGSQDYQQTLAVAAPAVAWLEQIRALTAAEGFHSVLARIIARAMQSGIGTLNRNSSNKEILRTIIWCAAVSKDPECIDALRQLAIWSVEHKTAQGKTIGIALAFVGCELSAAALRMIGAAAKRPSPKTRFNRYATHVESRIGLSKEESAERFIPTLDLDSNGIRRINCGTDGAIELHLSAKGAAVQFFNSSDKLVSAPPATMRRNHAESIAIARASAKALDKLISIQRGRIESLLFEEREWSFEVWQERYLNHPVVGTLARRLIWTVDGRSVLFQTAQATDMRGDSVEVAAQSLVRLWHPMTQRADEVRKWRDRLEAAGVTQPFKQAHREIYLLTDAERQTRTYSNRFAAHILNQSQFRALALARQWRRPFIGGWGGEDNAAHRVLPGTWRAEFWLEGVGEEYGPTGAFLHVTTDQVRFCNGDAPEPAPLEDVPALVFSEVMRDVDLFVGVASVGNNPEWHDGGPQERFRNYWQDYSFGDLSATANTRREVLQRLVPKLKIASQCVVDERFLVVRGQLRTYKIHLGSGNILMDPNAQYLCIVPKQADAPHEPVLLPFEGDRTLSVILSKAFLLAADDKIKDETIIRQIRAA